MLIRCVLIFLIFLSSCELWDDLNPNIIAKVDGYKITKNEIISRIKKENPDLKITKPILIFYVKERIKEIILEEEFKRLHLKITDEDKKRYSFLSGLDPEEIKREIIFDKVKKYIVCKITYPSDKECLRYYREHIHEFDHSLKLKLQYVIFYDQKRCDRFYRTVLKHRNFKNILKKFKVHLAYSGILKVKDIPREISSKIDYTKDNSIWKVNVEDRCYVINCIKYFGDSPLPFEEVKERIKRRLLYEKQSKFFKLWLSMQLKKHKIKIYYDKIK